MEVGFGYTPPPPLFFQNSHIFPFFSANVPNTDARFEFLYGKTTLTRILFWKSIHRYLVKSFAAKSSPGC